MYQPPPKLPTLEELQSCFDDDERDAMLATCPLADAIALKVALDGLQSPLESQFADFEIAKAREMEASHEAAFDDRPSNPGGYVSTIISEGLASGVLLDRNTEETLPEMAARLESEAALKAQAEERNRINSLVDRSVAASLAEFSRRFGGGQ